MASAAAPDPAVDALTSALNRALRALDTQGEEELACRLGAEAWTALRPRHPAQAEHPTRTLHALTARRAPRRPEGETP